jgi:hypothetical protein
MPPKLASDVTNKLSHSMINYITIIHSQINPYDEFNKHKFIAPTNKDLVDFLIKFSPITDPIQLKFFAKYRAHIITTNAKLGHHTLITYKQSSKSNEFLGRFYDLDYQSVITLCKVFKHTIFKFLSYTDIDMVSGHASIMISVCEKNNIPCFHVKQYITNKEEIVKELTEFYPGTDKKDIKFLFNIILYGGSFNTWKEQLSNDNDGSNYAVPSHRTNGKLLINSAVHEFILKFESDCKNFKKEVINHNKTAFETMKAKHTDKTLSEYEYENAFLSRFFQFIENHTIWLSYLFLVENKYIEPNVVVLEYDGLCIPPPNNKIHQIDQLIVDKLNVFLKEMLELDYVKMTIKPHDAADDGLLEKFRQIISDKSYANIKQRFEYDHDGYEHFKVKTTSTVLKVSKFEVDKERIIYHKSRDQITFSHEEEIYYDENGKSKCFITQWLKDPDIRCYTNIDWFPNNDCPSNTFNTYNVFNMDRVSFYTPDSDNLELYKYYLSTLCKGNSDHVNEIIYWHAALIQFPLARLPCNIFTGPKGVGKSNFILLWSSILGDENVISINNPENNLFGKYNDITKYKSIVDLPEIDYGIITRNIDKFKDLITGTKLIINEKYEKSNNSPNINKFIMSSNDNCPVCITDGDRRFNIFSASSKHANDTEFHGRILAMCKDVNARKTIFEFHKTLPNVGSYISSALHSSDKLSLYYEISKSPFEQFLDYFISKFGNGDDITVVTIPQLTLCISKFKDEYGIEKDDKLSSVTFKKLITNTKFDDFIMSNRTKSENMYLINTFMLNDNDISPEEFEIKYKDWKEQCRGVKYKKYAEYLKTL